VTGTEHGFPIRVAQATILGGWARAVTVAGGDGVGELRRGLAAYLASGAELDHPYHLGLLGDALAASGDAEEGLAVVEEAIRMAGTARPFYYQPELHRSAATCWPGTRPGRAGRRGLPAGHGARRRPRRQVPGAAGRDPPVPAARPGAAAGRPRPAPCPLRPGSPRVRARPTWWRPGHWSGVPSRRPGGPGGPGPR
jgi:hypothetical protein